MVPQYHPLGVAKSRALNICNPNIHMVFLFPINYQGGPCKKHGQLVFLPIFIFLHGVIVIFPRWSKLRGQQYFLHQSYLVKYSSFFSLFTNTQFLKLHAYMYLNFLTATAFFPITCRVRVYKFTIATRKVQSSPLWLLLPSQNPTHVNFFLSFLLIIIVPCKLLILSCDSPWLFQLFFSCCCHAP